MILQPVLCSFLIVTIIRSLTLIPIVELLILVLLLMLLYLLGLLLVQRKFYFERVFQLLNLFIEYRMICSEQRIKYILLFLLFHIQDLYFALVLNLILKEIEFTRRNVLCFLKGRTCLLVLLQWFWRLTSTLFFTP